MKPVYRFFYLFVLFFFVLSSFGSPAFAEDIYPVEDREIKQEYFDDHALILYDDGQWNPVVQYSGSPAFEIRFIIRFDLGAYSGLKVGSARLNFYLIGARDFEHVSIDAWYYQGDGTVSTEDYSRGDILAGNFSVDTTPADPPDPIEQWADFDVTELINSRTSDHVYFNVRLAGAYPTYVPNIFGSLGVHHYVNIAACEYGPSLSPRLSIEAPFVSAGSDRKVFGSVVLDGSSSYDPVGSIVSYQWLLECRGNSLYSRTATGATATVSGLRPGFYDVYLTVENDSGQTATGGFVLMSAPEETGDLDGDSDIDGSDLAVFADKFGSPAP